MTSSRSIEWSTWPPFNTVSILGFSTANLWSSLATLLHFGCMPALTDCCSRWKQGLHMSHSYFWPKSDSSKTLASQDNARLKSRVSFSATPPPFPTHLAVLAHDTHDSPCLVGLADMSDLPYSCWFLYLCILLWKIYEPTTCCINFFHASTICNITANHMKIVM